MWKLLGLLKAWKSTTEISISAVGDDYTNGYVEQAHLYLMKIQKFSNWLLKGPPVCSASAKEQYYRV